MLATQNLSFAYPGSDTLEFPDIYLPQGETLLLQGASGSGKSTLLALACGLLSASGGLIQVAGQELAGLHGAARDAWRGRTVGFLPQKLHLSQSLTVRGNLALVFFAAGLPEDARKIDAALQALGVMEVAGRYPSALSGGQAQRVALARAVLLSPSIVLADEPTASLDDEAADQAMALLASASQNCGASLVVATHDRRVAQALDAAGHTWQHQILQNLSENGILGMQNLRRAL